MLKLCAVFIFLSLAACTKGGSTDKSSERADADSGRPSGGTEGIPGYVIAPNRIKAHYTADRVVIEAPAGVVVPGKLPLNELRLSVLTAPVQSLNTIAAATSGTNVSIVESAVIGTLTPSSDGSFSGDFARPSVAKEAIAIVVGTSSSNGTVLIFNDEGASTVVTQLIPSEQIEVGFVSVSSPNAPRVAVSAVAEFVGASGNGGGIWSATSNAKTPDDGGAVTTANIPMNDRSEWLHLRGFFSNEARALPAGALISGIIVNCKWNGVEPEKKALLGMRVRYGPNSGIDKGGGYPLTTTLALSPDYGSSSDLWNHTGLTAADVNSSDFGITFAFQDSNGGVGGVSIDYCQMKIYFTAN